MFQCDSGSVNAVVRNTVLRIPSALTVIALAAVLTACGGGGGDDEVVQVTIAVQPTEQSGVVGGVIRFSVEASGTDLTFQWQRSTNAGSTWSDIAGATSSILELINVTADQDGHQFRAHINGKSGSATTSTVTLHVTPVVTPPSFTVDLSSPAELTAGMDATMSVTAAGANLTYLWQTRADSGSAWSDVQNSNAATLTLQAVPIAANGHQYRVIITNGAGSVTSGIATLAVTEITALPTITTQPQAQSVTEPNTATFTVAGSGNPTPTVQWQVSTDSGTTYTDIAGATAFSYTTGATSTSQSGHLYRAMLTNSIGSTPSNAARLSVAVQPVAPNITSAPASVTVAAGSLATFTLAVSGTPTPTVQWQVSTNGTTWTNITGATGASYTTPVLTTADSNKLYRAVATNSAGTATSDAAVLTVNAPVSVLNNRSWGTGVLLENSNDAVRDYATGPGFNVGISDGGVATAIFIQNTSSGGQTLQATDRMADDTGWSTPIAIDTGARVAYTGGFPPILSVSPNGHAVAVWYSAVSAFSGRIYASRRLTGGSWESPILIGTLISNGDPTAAINDNGDIAILFGSSTSAGRHPTMALRTAGESAYRIEHLTDSGMGIGSSKPIGDSYRAGLDNSGNVTVVAERSNATDTKDIVAYRGTVSAGFGASPVAESLEDRTADANLYEMRVGLNGHVAVAWKQDTAATANAVLISVRSPANGAWELKDLTPDFGTSPTFNGLRISDGTAGDVSLYEGCSVVRRIDGIWKAKQSLPTNCGIASGNGAMDRNGNYIRWNGAQWAAYDASLNVMIKPFPSGTATTADYILGVNKQPRLSPAGGDRILMALSPKGFGVSAVTTGYTVMPSSSGINGDSGSIQNIWGFYFK